MHTRIGIVLVLALAGSSAADRRGPVAPAAGADQGAGWYCYETKNPDAPYDNGSECERSEDSCEWSRDTMSSYGGMPTDTTFSDCTYSKTAAAFSNYVFQFSATLTMAYASMKDCESARHRHATSPGYANVSGCALVGATGTALNKTRLPSSDGWFCITIPAEGFGAPRQFGKCFRGQEECEAVLVGSRTCVASKTAWARSTPAAIAVFGNFDACNRKKPSNTSRCEEVE